MQVPHRYSGTPQIQSILERTTDGPCKGIHNPVLAQTTEGPRCTSFPWLHQLLSKIHPQLLGDNPSPEPPLQKVHHLAFWHRRGKSIPEPKKGVQIRTSTSSPGPGSPYDGRNGCVRLRNCGNPFSGLLLPHTTERQVEL